MEPMSAEGEPRREVGDAAPPALSSGSFMPLCGVEELAPGSGRRFRAGERWVALFNVGGAFYAVEELCPHSGGPLSEGAVDGCRVICSWHYAAFDLKTGASLDPISRHDVDTFPVLVREGKVWIRVDGDTSDSGDGMAGGDEATPDEKPERTA
jgi:nitrite reductase/ring-hydroxylating ferredoxin subunit